jgi:hypothetical protein
MDCDIGKRQAPLHNAVVRTVLQRHPFPVVAHFEKVIAISFAFPVEALRPFVSEPLEIDTYNDLGFVTVALVWTRLLRPAGFPQAFGNDFFLAGYRVFARMIDDTGGRLRGLKILRSETDKRRMVFMGNLLTRYNYRRVRPEIRQDGLVTEVATFLPDNSRTLHLRLESGEDVALPDASPFPDWRTARQFAGPMPFTFSPEPNGRCIVVEGRRSTWAPRPIRVAEWDVSLFDETSLRTVKPILANAFEVNDVAYRWEKGRLVRPGVRT